jgi:formylglycine-generating enzyme required for sulfatase activity
MLPETYTLRREEAAVKTSIIRSISIVLFLGSSPRISATQGMPQNNLWTASFPASGSCSHAARMRGMRGFAIEPLAAPLQAAGVEKPQPLSKQQLLDLITGGVANQRAMELVRDRGIDFQVDEDYIRTLRRAGANDLLIAALRKKSAPTEGITVETEPNAQVFLDGDSQGHADSQGVLVFRAKVGPHVLKVSQTGKRDFSQKFTLVDEQPAHIVAPLAGLAGGVRVKALPGASIWLDNSIPRTVGANGELLLSNIPAGAHALRVTAVGKVDDLRDIVIAAGVEASVEVTLADSVRSNPQDGLKYVWIAPGRFLMGCSPGDIDCADPEKPAHPVILRRAYWIGQTEVSVDAYRRYAAAANVKMPPTAPKLYHGWNNRTLPMVNIVWDEANQYCAWAGGRLPTEAEWEYAARGGSPQARYGNLDDIAWTKENAQSQTHPVAGKQANGYGLFDMLGNVWEWVSDWYAPDYYQSSPAQNPTGPATGQQRVLRGGSWIVDSKLLRVSDRYSIEPTARSDFFGFRCVWEPKAP